jgi:hypothetical protein
LKHEADKGGFHGDHCIKTRSVPYYRYHFGFYDVVYDGSRLGIGEVDQKSIGYRRKIKWKYIYPFLA